MIDAIDQLDRPAEAVHLFLHHVPHTVGLGCRLWTGNRTGQGYARLSVRVNGRYVEVRAHRFAFLLAYGYLPAAPLILTHTCGQRLCVNPLHLREGTHESNAADRDRHGRTRRGAQSWSSLHPECLARGARNGARLHPERLERGSGRYNAILNEEQVQEMWNLRRAGWSYQCLAQRYGVSKSAIYNIVAGLRWKHVIPASDG